MRATIGRWGRSLAVRLPAEVAAKTQLKEGQHVDVSADGDGVVIRRSTPKVSVEGMFRGRTPDEWRTLYAGSYDWGPDVGREIVDE